MRVREGKGKGKGKGKENKGTQEETAPPLPSVRPEQLDLHQRGVEKEEETVSVPQVLLRHRDHQRQRLLLEARLREILQLGVLAVPHVQQL